MLHELEEEDENVDDKESAKKSTNGITNPIDVKYPVINLNDSGNSKVSDDVFL